MQLSFTWAFECFPEMIGSISHLRVHEHLWVLPLLREASRARVEWLIKRPEFMVEQVTQKSSMALKDKRESHQSSGEWKSFLTSMPGPIKIMQCSSSPSSTSMQHSFSPSVHQDICHMI